jgi:hypothetical protein
MLHCPLHSLSELVGNCTTRSLRCERRRAAVRAGGGHGVSRLTLAGCRSLRMRRRKQARGNGPPAQTGFRISSPPARGAQPENWGRRRALSGWCGTRVAGRGPGAALCPPPAQLGQEYLRWLMIRRLRTDSDTFREPRQHGDCIPESSCRKPQAGTACH